MQFTEHEITINGLKTVYIEGGKGSTLVWIPGWGAQGNTYLKPFTLLQQKYRIISPDMPGFGKADIPKKIWSFAEYGAFVDTLIDQLSLKEICLVGHSTGGAIALHTTAQNKNIRKLVLIDPYGLPLGRSRLGLVVRYLREFFIELGETVQIKNSIHTIANLFNLMRNIRYVFPYSLKIFDQQLKDDSLLFTKITTHTLILWATKDAVFGPDYAKLMQKRLPDAEMHSVVGTHNWIIFRPEEILKYI